MQEQDRPPPEVRNLECDGLKPPLIGALRIRRHALVLLQRVTVEKRLGMVTPRASCLDLMMGGGSHASQGNLPVDLKAMRQAVLMRFSRPLVRHTVFSARP